MMNDYGRVPNPFNDSDNALSAHRDNRDSAARSFENLSSGNSDVYSPRKQVSRVANRRIWELAVTILLVLLTIAILIIWDHKKYVPTSSKTMFNFFSTVLSIALGLNFSVRCIVPFASSKGIDQPA